VTDASDRGKRQHKRLTKTCEVEFYSNDEAYRGISDNFSIASKEDFGVRSCNLAYHLTSSTLEKTT
jgi:hypothetical protein